MDIRQHSTGRRRQPWRRLRRGAIAVFTVLVVAALCGQAATADTSGGLGIHAIRHVIVVMMENRSFDSFFGTYPGADGLPRSHGRFTSCLPDPQIHRCQRPWHDRRFINGGAAHGSVAFANDVDHGRMDGFVAQAENRNQDRWCADSAAAVCSVNANIDVMGYHTAHEIPAYWSYAKHFVLDDHMFEPVGAWSGVAHLFEVSEWSASCSNGWAPMSCKAYIRDGWWPDVTGTAIFCALSPVLHVLHLAPGCTPEAQAPPPDFAWTDMTYLLYKRGVSWGYFVTPGGAPDCENGSATCQSTQVSPGSDSVWNPLPSFATVRQDNQLGNIQTTSQFLTLAQQGELPAVSWVVPDQPHSDHPPADLRGGQAFVANIVNTVASGPDWNSTAIFLAWDDWGGFYDNVRPPKVGGYRFGFRVPALMISPYARRGFIDHQAMSFDAYNKFIEDDFLGGQRLNPRTDGRPDSRPNVREDLPDTGDLTRDFNFNQRPLPPLILPLYPRGRPHL